MIDASENLILSCFECMRWFVDSTDVHTPFVVSLQNLFLQGHYSNLSALKASPTGI